MNLDRGEYGLIYHQTFGKQIGREACRKGWERWQQVLASDHGFIVPHPDGTPMPAPHANDYWAFVTLGPLRFLARMPKLVEKALRARNIALSKLVIDLSAGEWETLKRREDQRRRHWRWLRDEIGAVIGERIRWRWRTLRNSETGAIRHERGPLTVQHEWGAVRIEIGRLWFVRVRPNIRIGG